MKTILLIIIIGLSIAGIFGGLYTANVLQNIEDQKAQEEWRKLRESAMNNLEKQKISEDVDNFDKTWGGPGNRHPAFLGFDIPEICTEDMIKHLAKHSTMFERNTPYILEWVSMDDSIDTDDFDRCVEELLERNSKELENED